MKRIVCNICHGFDFRMINSDEYKCQGCGMVYTADQMRSLLRDVDEKNDEADINSEKDGGFVTAADIKNKPDYAVKAASETADEPEAGFIAEAEDVSDSETTRVSKSAPKAKDAPKKKTSRRTKKTAEPEAASEPETAPKSKNTQEPETASKPKASPKKKASTGTKNTSEPKPASKQETASIAEDASGSKTASKTNPDSKGKTSQSTPKKPEETVTAGDNRAVKKETPSEQKEKEIERYSKIAAKSKKQCPKCGSKNIEVDGVMVNRKKGLGYYLSGQAAYELGMKHGNAIAGVFGSRVPNGKCHDCGCEWYV